MTRGVNGGCWRADEAAGADNLTWSIDNTLPTGMTFDSTTGDFCGTPTTNLTSTQITVKAENLVGSNTSVVFLTVNEPIAQITYGASALQLTKNELYRIKTSTSGGHIATTAVHPDLPAGMSLTANGTIIGRPLEVLNATQFTVYVNNSGGSSSTSITLSSRDAFSYATWNYTLYNTASLIEVSPVVNFTGALNWSISPALPQGLSIGASNGTIYGTPQEQLPIRTTFTVKATSSTYAHTHPFKLRVIAVAPSLDFEGASSTVDLIRYEPTLLVLGNLGDDLDSVSVSPSLPTGWTLYANGTIRAMPQDLTGEVTYTVTGTNTGGSDSASVTVRSIGAYHYLNTNHVFTRSTSNVFIQPVVNYTNPISWTVYPALPGGLSIGASNGTIYGVPTQQSGNSSFFIRAATGNYTHTRTLWITVDDIAPIARFNVSSTVSMIRNEPSMLVMDNLGGDAVNASITPNLPLGLQLQDNGSISGIPLTFSGVTQYTVTIYNTGGNSSTSVNLRVIGALHYTQTNFNLREESSSIFAVPTVNYSGNLSWSTYPTLPEGVSIGPSNGTIYGVPTESIERTNFTVRAWSSSTLHTALLSIEVLPVAPQGTYNTSGTVVLSVNQTVWLAYESGGGAASTITVTPALPSGLSMLGNGTIYGTPTAVQPATTYSVNMSNEGGYDVVSVTLQVKTPFHYNDLDHTLTRNSSLIYLAPTVNLSEATTWSVFPALPSGLSIGSSNGTVYGTPTQNLTRTAFTIRAQTWSTVHTATLMLEVLEIAPSLSFTGAPSRTLIKGEPVSLSPVNLGGPVSSASISPSLPSGLFLAGDGSILGTPTVLSSSTVYTITGLNTGGNDTATITLEVLTAFSFDADEHTFRRNTSSVFLQPTVNLSSNASWSTWPSLPSGLTIGATNGTIYGTPTVNLTATTFTVRAQTSSTTHQVSMTFTVIELAPVVSWNVSVASVQHVKGEAFSLGLINTGGPISSRSITPALPSGLFLRNDGSIVGSPQGVSVATSYTVTVGNTGGNVTTSITIEVVDAFYYGDTNHTLRRDTTSLYLLPSSNLSGNVAWSISPSLPSGLSIGASNGTLYGVPSVNSTFTNYTISAVTDSTTHVFSVGLGVIEIAPDVAWLSSTSSLTLVRREAMHLPLVSNGGPISSVSISPSLPNGVSISSNGSLSGAPTVFQNSTTYTITVSNSGGTDTITVAFEVVAGFHYDVSAFELNRGTSNVFEMPTVNFSATASWSVSPALPSGLALGGANGTLFGIPTQNSSLTTYTVQATTASTTHVRTFTLRVIEAAPEISLSASASTQTLVRGESGLVAVSNNGGPIASVSITPSLPSGLSLTSNGSIVGTPSVLLTPTAYTINASNEGGSDSYTFTLAVVSAFSYQATTLSLQRNTSVVYMAPMVNLSGAVSWSTLPSLPQGLSIGSTNGTIWGVPTVSQSLTNFTVMATSSSSTTHTMVLQVTVSELAPNVEWDLSSTTVQAVKGEPLNIDLLNSGGTITSVSIWPSLPSGLTLTSSGSIDGTPTAFASATTYIVNVSNSGGTDSVSITLSVVPAFTHGVDALELSRNQSTVYLPPTVNVTGNGTWSILPSLPAGLSLGAMNGTVYGTPTVNLSQTSFTVRLTTDNAVHLRTLTISIDEVAPVLTGPVAVTLIKKENASFASTNSGGPVASFTVSPSLPAGLWLSNDGRIYGMPTGLLNATTFVVNATNSGGSDLWSFSLSIVTAIDYDVTSLALQRGDSAVLLAPNVNTTATLSWSITPSLPSGLQIGASNGTIWGTPTQTRSSTLYTIQAASSGSVHTTTLTLVVAEAAPEVSFDVVLTTQTLVKNEAVSIVMLNAGGLGSTVSVSPSLPSGLSLTANGSIVGTPGALSSLTTYTVWVNNTGGSSNATLSIEVVGAFSYSTSSATLSRDLDYAFFVPTVNLSSGAVWSVVPSLPAGLSIGATNGTIWGTPSVNSTRTTYTVRSTTSSFVHTATLVIEVTEVAPQVSMPSSVQLVRNEAAQIALSSTGGPVATFAVTPALPAGLRLAANGSILGTPTGLSPARTFTIYANNSGGSSSVSVVLSVVSPFAYSTTNVEAQRGSTYVFIEASSNLTGSVTWSVLPSLPTGLFIGANNGTIYGTPTQNLTQTVFTVRAGTQSATHLGQVSITVVEVAPVLSYTTATLVVGEQALHQPTTSGGPIATFEVVPPLPAGLSLDQSGRLTGWPTANMTLSTYTVWGNNSGGSSQAVLRIVVYENAPVISLPLENITLTYNSAVSTIIPLNVGGDARNWSVTPSLPSGLSMSVNGHISGTPVALITNATYTLWASNDGGTDRFVFNLTVQEMSPAVQFVHLQNNYTVDDSVYITLVNSGGEPSTYTVSPSLPTGLVLSSSNGSIYGVAMTAQSVTQYTVWANNSQGSAEATVFIRINDAAPSIAYPVTWLNLTRYTPMQPVMPQTSNVDSISWSIQPSLPVGLSFNTSTGLISGTPDIAQAQTKYTVTATAGGHSTSADVWLMVAEAPPWFEYDDDVLDLVNGTAMDTMFPTVSNVSVDAWTITPSLPSGLNFVGGVMYGTANTTSNTTLYTITASNSGGHHNVTLLITVLLDSDGDGIADVSDGDDDNDGVIDSLDPFPLDPSESIDTDYDGIGNNADLDDDNDGTNDTDDAFPLDPKEDADLDKDGLGDNADADDDGDGCDDLLEDYPRNGSMCFDFDLDGLGDAEDDDDDNDGYNDVVDAFPYNSSEWNDTDMDGIGDLFDDDDDGDNYTDVMDAFPHDPREWLDSDGDGFGDNADPDDDNDGVADLNDPWPLDPRFKADANNNTIPDIFEASNLDDVDADGWSNMLEYICDTNATNSTDVPADFDEDGTCDVVDMDDDGDGYADQDDDLPFNRSEWLDTDADGIGNNADRDDDGDGRNDGLDAFPLDPTEWEDLNNNGIGDNSERREDQSETSVSQGASVLDQVPVWLLVLIVLTGTLLLTILFATGSATRSKASTVVRSKPQDASVQERFSERRSSTSEGDDGSAEESESDGSEDALESDAQDEDEPGPVQDEAAEDQGKASVHPDEDTSTQEAVEDDGDPDFPDGPLK
ncbi:MAG: putative Ig domain-containing protein [Poseidonia sp.]